MTYISLILIYLMFLQLNLSWVVCSKIVVCAPTGCTSMKIWWTIYKLSLICVFEETRNIILSWVWDLYPKCYTAIIVVVVPTDSSSWCWLHVISAEPWLKFTLVGFIQTMNCKLSHFPPPSSVLLSFLLCWRWFRFWRRNHSETSTLVIACIFTSISTVSLKITVP